VKPLTYIIINLLLFLSWFILLYKRKGSLSFIDRIIGTFVLGIAQIILTEMILGIVFKRLHIIPLSVFNLFISSFVIGIASVRTSVISILVEIKDTIVRCMRIMRRDAVLTIIAIIFIVLVWWVAFIGYLFPSYTWDALWYHLPIVGFIIQSGAIQENPAPFMIDQFMNIFPKNIELLFLWNIIFMESDMITDLSQLFFSIMGVLTIYSIAVKLGMERVYAMYSGILFFFAPIIILQSSTNYVDVAVSVLFIIAINFLITHQGERLPILLAGIATGILLGSKGSGPLFVGVLSVAILVRGVMFYLTSFKSLHLEGRGGLIKAIRGYTLYFLLPSVLLGGYWYIKNWFLYGNPVYPMEISFFNTTIFKGLYSGIIDPEPDIIKRLSPIKRLFHVWLERVDYYLYDSRFSGFGPIWFILSLPSIAFAGAYSIRERRYRFYFLSAILIITFILYPRNWNTRYVIFITGLGSLSIGMMLEYLKGKDMVLKVVILVLVFYTAMTSNSPCVTPEKVREFVSLPPSRRTIVEHDPFNIHLQARQEYGYWRWIRDNISRGDVLAYTFEPLFLSPLWNGAYSNRIVYVKADSYDKWFKGLRDEKVTHILVRLNSLEDRWIEGEGPLSGYAGQKGRFVLSYSDNNYRIYRFVD